MLLTGTAKRNARLVTKIKISLYGEKYISLTGFKSTNYRKIKMIFFKDIELSTLGTQ
jgi:hypothetical protein